MDINIDKVHMLDATVVLVLFGQFSQSVLVCRRLNISRISTPQS